MKTLFYFVHGKPIRFYDVLIVHGAGIFFAGLILRWVPTWSLFEKILLFLLVWEVGGGLIAASRRAHKNWMDSQPLVVQFVYLSVHWLPVLLIDLFLIHSSGWPMSLRFFPYVFLGGAILLLVKGLKWQRTLAFGLTAYGLIWIQMDLGLGSLWKTMAALYLVKLFLAFSADR